MLEDSGKLIYNKQSEYTSFRCLSKNSIQNIKRSKLSRFIKFLPSFFKESLKKSPNFLQQLLTIDNSKYTEKKTIL